MRKIETKFPTIQAGARANPEAGHLVFIVPDKEKRRLPCQLFSFHNDAKIEEGKSAEGVQRCPEEGWPFAALESLLDHQTTENNARINSETRVVDEDATVHLPDVDYGHVMIDDGAHRARQIEWNPQILGKMIKRAERQYAQRFRATGHLCGNRAHGSVPSSSNNRFFLPSGGLPRHCTEVIYAGNGGNVGTHSGRTKKVRNPRRQIALLGRAASVGVKDDEHSLSNRGCGLDDPQFKTQAGNYPSLGKVRGRGERFELHDHKSSWRRRFFLAAHLDVRPTSSASSSHRYKIAT
jgi:hypothetical protein